MTVAGPLQDSNDSIPWLSTDQMREVDRIMIEELHIELIQMMENAGRSLAALAIDRYRPDLVAVGAGSGGNGGGGLVAARHLANRGVDVVVVLTRTGLEGVPGHQLDVLQRMNVGIEVAVDDWTPPWEERPDVWLDAVIGYSLAGPPTGSAAALIRTMNHSRVPVLSLDVPSGLDATTGVAADPSVVADATLTLAAPKVGLRHHRNVGDLFVADISVPPAVFDRLGFSSYHPLRA